MSNATDLSPGTKRLVVIGTMLGLLLAASNQTVISTALPTIVADLGGLNLLAWIFTGYMLTSTTIVPISGKLSDIYGRKPFFMGGIIIFMLASIAGGFAQSMEQLIAVRAVQGIGGGMLLSSVFAIIADLYSPAERGRYQGIFTAMFGVASIIGPTMGGVVTDYIHWRGIFYMNFPFGFAALAMVGLGFPKLERAPRKVVIDYAGVAFLTSTVVCLLLALTWANDVYPWASVEIVGLLTAAALLLCAFLFVESKAAEPIIPLRMFRNRVFALGSLLTIMSGVTLTSVVTFMPMFLQGVLGATATSSGLVLSPMMVGVMIGSTGGGVLVSRTGRYRAIIVAGSGILLAGMLVLSQFNAGTGWVEAIAGMALVGFGIGFAVPVVNLAVQNTSPRRYLGVATASSQFFRSIGGTLGVAVFGTLVVTGIHANLDRNLSAEVREAASPALIERLGEAEVILSTQGRSSIEAEFIELDSEDGPALYDSALASIKTSLADAVTSVFFLGMVVAIGTFVISALIPARPLDYATADDDPVPELPRRGPPLNATPVERAEQT